MRKIIRKILIYFLYYSGFNFLCSPFLNNKIFVLMHHAVGANDLYPDLAVGADEFEKRLLFLKREGHMFIKFSDLKNYSEGKWNKPTIIYFDDGFKDILLNAAPILEKHNIPFTVFISTGIVDKSHILWTIKHRHFLRGKGHSPLYIKKEISRLRGLSESMRGEELNKIYAENHFDADPRLFDIFLTWDDVCFLRNNGVEIGSHGVSHKRLTDCSADEIIFELRESKKIIEKQLGKPVDVFSYPYGRWNGDTNKALEKAGYKFAVSKGGGLNDKKEFSGSPVFLRNIFVPIGASLTEFKVRLYSLNALKNFYDSSK